MRKNLLYLGLCVLFTLSLVAGCGGGGDTATTDGAGVVITAVAAEGWVSAALQSDGTVWTWGNNEEDQLGYPSSKDCSFGVGGPPFACSTRPMAVNGITDVQALCLGGTHVLALKEDGTLYAWGANLSGQLGDGSTTKSQVPVQVVGEDGSGFLADVSAVGCGQNHSLAVTTGGEVYAWGANGKGQLGDGTTASSTTPVQVTGLNGAGAVSAGADFSMALKTDGTVYTWGGNGSGQLGNGTNNDSLTPVAVQNVSGISVIAAGWYYALAVTEDGGLVKGWGSNGSGQLGDGTYDDSNTPVTVNDLTNVIAIAATQAHTLAVKKDGSVRGWGANWNGQLGDGTTISTNSPVEAVNIANAASVAVGEGHSIVLYRDGSVKAWGWNASGQVGDGTSVDKTSPVKIGF